MPALSKGAATQSEAETWLPLPAAAVQLGLSWSQAYNAVLLGHLEGRQSQNGRWLCSPSSIERFALQQQKARSVGVGAD